jgi:uncharacterized membrane protein
MASFEKKLDSFLTSAVDKKLVDENKHQELMHYARSDELNNKGWFSLSNALGSLGMAIVGFGIIMIIAHNWDNLSNLTKISSFIGLLAGSHLGGLFLAEKGYEKLGASMHVLGAILFIAGIGLVAQMFHLSSKTGASFLLWGVAILPLALLLRNGPITLLAIVAFTAWGNVFGSASRGFLHMSDLGHLVFNPAICIAMVLGGMTLRERGSEMASYLQVPGMLGVIGWVYGFGFMHYFGRSMFSGGESVLGVTVLLICAVMGVSLWRKNRNVPATRQLLLALGSVGVVLLIMIVLSLIKIDVNLYIERMQFGRTSKLYFWPMIISVMSWVAYFVIAFWGVIYGALSHQRWLLNCSVLLVGIGVLTRFLDLMGSMLDAGVMFVASGLVLFATGFVLEKWRRNLIEKQDLGR